jgi:hypothetical protein
LKFAFNSSDCTNKIFSQWCPKVPNADEEMKYFFFLFSSDAFSVFHYLVFFPPFSMMLNMIKGAEQILISKVWKIWNHKYVFFKLLLLFFSPFFFSFPTISKRNSVIKKKSNHSTKVDGFFCWLFVESSSQRFVNFKEIKSVNFRTSTSSICYKVSSLLTFRILTKYVVWLKNRKIIYRQK